MSSAHITSTDLLIIGAGPAGLSAALLFARLGRPCVVYDSGSYRNETSLVTHTIPAFDGADPRDYRVTARKQMEVYDWVKFRDAKVVGLSKLGQEKDEAGGGILGNTLFECVDNGGNKVRARKVIIATGIKDNLPGIPGLADIWGTRAIHCVFCHGTETRHSPIAFLLPPPGAHNDKIVEVVFKLWSSLRHPSVTFLTHGVDITTPSGLTQSGLEQYMSMVEAKGYHVVCEKIEKIDQKADDRGIIVRFEGGKTLELGYIAIAPNAFSPHDHAAAFLTPQLLGAELTAMGTVAPVDTSLVGASPLPPRMGDDPRTATPGLFWAGNAGSVLGNVNISVAQGQAAGFAAGEELGKEDMNVFNEK